MDKKIKSYLLRQIANRENLGLNSFFTNLPDPDQILAENGYDYKILRDLLIDAHLTAVVMQRKAQVLKTGWEITNIKNEKLKEEVIEFLSNYNLRKIISEMLDAFLYGFQVCEINWGIKDNKIIPVDIVGKPQEWFIFDSDNKLRLRKRINGFYIFEEGERLPEYKFILLQHNASYVNPYGEKLLSKVFWAVTLKTASRDFWQHMVEKYGMPYLVGYYSATASQSDKEELSQNIQDIVDNQGGILPTGTQLDFKENVKYEIGQLYNNIITFYDKEISKAILSVTLTTTIEKLGSYRLAGMQKDIIDYISLADKKMIEEAINKVIEYYLYLNYGEEIEDIKFKLVQKEQIIETTAKRDKILKEMGVVFTEEYFKKRYNLSEKDFKLKTNEEKL